MEQWSEIRRRVLTGELTKPAARKIYNLHWDMLTKILENEEPPGYRKQKEREKPILGPFIPLIHEIREADKKAPKKQRHAAKRIFERLREEGYGGGLSATPEHGFNCAFLRALSAAWHGRIAPRHPSPISCVWRSSWRPLGEKPRSWQCPSRGRRSTPLAVATVRTSPAAFWSSRRG
jgi:hypothetical protein